MLYTCIAVVRFMEGEPKKPWGLMTPGQRRTQGTPCEHVAELTALFELHGIGCRRASAEPTAEEILLFDSGVDVAAI